MKITDIEAFVLDSGKDYPDPTGVKRNELGR